MKKNIIKKKIVVTGCAGFIGSNLIDKLLSLKSDQIIGIDNLSTGQKRFIDKALKNRKTGKRETKVIETNGLTTLAGMNYSDDPGFDVGCAKPRNKMPSRITTVKKG